MILILKSSQSEIDKTINTFKDDNPDYEVINYDINNIDSNECEIILSLKDISGEKEKFDFYLMIIISIMSLILLLLFFNIFISLKSYKKHDSSNVIISNDLNSSVVSETILYVTEIETSFLVSEKNEIQTSVTEITTEDCMEIITTTANTFDDSIPDGQLVKIVDYIPDIVIDLRYSTSENFTGNVIYDDNNAYLCYGTLKKLAKVQSDLSEKGYKLVIWDAYRSYEAQCKLWEVYPNPTYVADPKNGRSSHNLGNTVDISIVHSDGSFVFMPSQFDEFSLIADRNYYDVPQVAADNSLMLEQIMVDNGFKGYSGEWWHYEDIEKYALIDITE